MGCVCPAGQSGLRRHRSRRAHTPCCQARRGPTYVHQLDSAGAGHNGGNRLPASLAGFAELAGWYGRGGQFAGMVGLDELPRARWSRATKHPHSTSTVRISIGIGSVHGYLSYAVA